MGHLSSGPIPLKDAKHVDIGRAFAKDESSILSTSNWLDSPYSPTSLRKVLALKLRGLRLSAASSEIPNSKVVVFHPLPNSARFLERGLPG